MKYFFDTEFIEDGKTIDLVSIGIVAEDERTLYLQNCGANFKAANDWVWRNVFPHLTHFSMRGERSCQPYKQMGGVVTDRCIKTDECPWRTRYSMRDAVRAFMDVEKYGKPEIWGYYADYDWVAFCHLFGAMIELPKGFPMYCMDLKQLCVSMGDPRLPAMPNTTSHHALSDAREVKYRYEWLIDWGKDPGYPSQPHPTSLQKPPTTEISAT